MNTTYSSILIQTVSDLAFAAAETGPARLSALSEKLGAAEAPLTMIRAEKVLANTSTNQASISQAFQSMYDASPDFQLLVTRSESSGMKYPGNVVFLIVFLVLLIYRVGMLYRSRYHAFNITFILGEICQVVGWLGRVLAIKQGSLFALSMMQGIGITISPTFLMAGIYFLFAQLVVIHGREFSVLKPMWYSYFFITTDVISLFIQSGGGAILAKQGTLSSSQNTGTIVMLLGIGLQIVAMTIFLVFWFEFLNRVYFKPLKNNQLFLFQASPFAKRSFGNYMRFLFNARLIREFRMQNLEVHYTPKFHEIRSRALFPWFPLAMSIAVLLVYIRCVYRVVELAQGYSGYLMTHEVFLFALDGAMIAMTCLIFMPFHPLWVFGRKNIIKLALIKKNYGDELQTGNMLCSDVESLEVRAERKVI